MNRLYPTCRFIHQFYTSAVQRSKPLFFIASLIAVAVFSFCIAATRTTLFTDHEVGDAVDSLNGVKVYYNGSVDHVCGRNVAADGYNLGLKYQCVEFVKRYYYQHLNHKMPDSYGHAKDFFNKKLADGQWNKQRNLTQCSNPSQRKPQADDLLVFDGHAFNPYGHVAIISAVTDNTVEIIQQNPGPSASSRATFKLQQANGRWHIDDSGVLAWLRK
ncbi:MAG: CHAP domain-containing protein [Flavobacteriales bacterium]|nr:CHAP domain-containing protein [Flavobacteriales bacterium]MCB9448346.1 CHAP domain-containing protein [Flavobacteriales bacterium]